MAPPIKRNKKRALIFTAALMIVGLLTLSLTTTRPPSRALADEIDRALEQDPCIGSVERWPSRYYGWRPTSWFWANDIRGLLWMVSGPWFGSDTSKVSVRLYQGASSEDYPAGRHLLRADQDKLSLDSSKFLFASGIYDVRTRQVRGWMCGPSDYPVVASITFRSPE
jgi:hypothetical protein